MSHYLECPRCGTAREKTIVFQCGNTDCSTLFCSHCSDSRSMGLLKGLRLLLVDIFNPLHLRHKCPGCGRVEHHNVQFIIPKARVAVQS